MGRRFLCRLSAARPALPGLQEFFTQSADINSAILLAIFSSAGGLCGIFAEKRLLWLRAVRTGCPSLPKGVADGFVELCMQRSTARMISGCWIKSREHEKHRLLSQTGPRPV